MNFKYRLYYCDNATEQHLRKVNAIITVMITPLLTFDNNQRTSTFLQSLDADRSALKKMKNAVKAMYNSGTGI